MKSDLIKNLSKRTASTFIVKLLAGVFLLFGGCEKDDQWATKLLPLTRNIAMRYEITTPSVSLGKALLFTVLASNTIINYGESIIQGDVGVGSFPIRGFRSESIAQKNNSTYDNTINGKVTGAVHTSNAQVEQALNDAVLWYYSANKLLPNITYNTMVQLDKLVFTPGIYHFPSKANLALNGTLTLDFQGNDQALFIFQVGSSLTAMSNSSIVAINTVNASNAGNNVFWTVGSSAKISGNSFIGNVISLGDISMSNTGNAGATNVLGRVISLRGSLTMIRCNISRCHDTTIETNSKTKTSENFVTGGGSIEQTINDKGNTIDERNKATFGLSFGIKDGRYWGLLSFVDYSDKDIRFKSISVKSFTVIDQSTRQIKGIAKVNNQNNFDYTLIVKDNNENGDADYFDIKLSNGFSASGSLTDGEIQFHIRNANKILIKPITENNRTLLVNISNESIKETVGTKLSARVFNN